MKNTLPRIAVGLAAVCATVSPVWSAPATPAVPVAPVAAAREAAPALPATGNPKADPAAYALLRAAHDARQVLPADFPGFEADVTYRAGAKSVTGKLKYRRGEKASLEVTGLSEDEKDWFQDQVLSFIGHRRGGDFAKGDGRNPLRFGGGPDAPAENAFGKLIELDDAIKSNYRVRDNKVIEVTRTMGDTRFTITVNSTFEADPENISRDISPWPTATLRLVHCRKWTSSWMTTKKCRSRGFPNLARSLHSEKRIRQQFAESNSKT